MGTVFFTILSILGAVLAVEIGGYVWHRWAEHYGIFGRPIVARHLKHHDQDYPVGKLRIETSKYKSAGSWSWYILGLLLILAMYFLVPSPYNYIMIIAGLVYAKFVISYLHSKYHTKGHWLANNKRFLTIQKLHDIHHWGPYNFGILFFFIDRLLGTYSSDFPEQKQNNFRLAKVYKNT